MSLYKEVGFEFSVNRLRWNLIHGIGLRKKDSLPKKGVYLRLTPSARLVAWIKCQFFMPRAKHSKHHSGGS